MSTRVETYVGGGCRYGKGTTANPCTGNQDANHIFSKKNSTELRRSGVNHSAAAPRRSRRPTTRAGTRTRSRARRRPARRRAALRRPSTRTIPTRDNNVAASEPDAGDLLHLPRRPRRLDDARRRDHRGCRRRSRVAVGHRLPDHGLPDPDRRRVDERHGRLRNDDLDRERGVNSSTAAAHVTSSTVIWDDATRAARSPGTRRRTRSS